MCKKVLDEYKNLKYLSRDRGYQYKALSSKYIHIADGFHLLQNFTDKVSEYIKAKIPNRIIINTANEKTKVIKEAKTNNTEITNAHKKNLIRKYREMKNIKSESMYTSTRYSYFDSYSTLIKRRLDAGYSIKFIFEEIKVLDPDSKIKYGALSNYIRKYKSVKSKK